MSTANQKIITNTVKQKCDGDNHYATLNLDALQSAMNTLSGETFKLWVYFAKNKNGYSYELSKAAAEQYGISKNSYYRGLETLEKFGYIQKTGKNTYIFVERPDTLKQNSQIGKSQSQIETNESHFGNFYSQIETENSQIEKNFSQNGTQNSQNGTDLSQNGYTNNINNINNNNNINKNIIGDFQFLNEEEESLFYFEYDCYKSAKKGDAWAFTQAMNCILNEREESA